MRRTILSFLNAGKKVLFLTVTININEEVNTENLQLAVGGRHCEFV